MPAPEIRVRAVKGRIVEPFRGSLDLEQPDRFEARTADTQPIDAIAERLRRVPEAQVFAKGRRFVIKRKAETVRIAFASAAQRVSLEDAAIGGDGMLAIEALYALLPLIGAFEIKIGSHVDLVDGHEPAPAVIARYEAHFIKESLHRAREMSKRARVPAFSPATVAKRSHRGAVLALIALIVFATLGSLFYLSQRSFSKPVAGARCSANIDCRTGLCLKDEKVCSRLCHSDSDCPATMTCGAAMLDQTGLQIRFEAVTACMPRP